MTSAGTQSDASRAIDHLTMARQLRDVAFRLKTPEARDKLMQLAALYEHLSVYYLDKDADRAI